MSNLPNPGRVPFLVLNRRKDGRSEVSTKREMKPRCGFLARIAALFSVLPNEVPDEH
ncbi:MAG: hypothetical protein ACFFC0_04975 [Promethearchaeota archaeon]